MSDKLANLESQLAAVRESLADAEQMFELIDKAVKGDKGANRGWVLAHSTVTDTRAMVEKLVKQIDNERETAKAASIIKPLVEAFGTVTLSDGSNAPANFHIVDLEKLQKDAAALAARGNDRVKLFAAVRSAVEAAGITPDDTIDRPIHFVVEGNTVKISVASRGGGRRAAGTGSGRATGKPVRITSAQDPGLVGRTVGSKDSTYASWREFLQKEAPAKFAELEAGKANGSNYSARVHAVKLFNITHEDVAVETAEAGAEAAS